MRWSSTLAWVTLAFAAQPGIACAEEAGQPIARPPGKYAVTVETRVMVPMRDGIKLATALYKPVGATGKLPIVLIRTPYGANRRAMEDARFFASHGYVVAVQDKRGRHDSEGRYGYLRSDNKDGYDAIEWLARQAFSSGKVGMYGCSYDGAVQELAAMERPPSLAALLIKGTGQTLARPDEDSPLTRYGYQFTSGDVFTGGVFELASTAAWQLDLGSNVFLGRPAHLSEDEWRQIADLFELGPRTPEVDVKAMLWELPVKGMLRRHGAPHNDYDKLIDLGPIAPYWKEQGYFQDARISAPALHMSGWYDTGPAQQLYNMKQFAKYATNETARRNQYAVISPMGHCISEKATEKTLVGELPVGDARFDYWNLYLDWFATWLKGEKRGVDRWPRVRYYLIGANQWRTADDWPVPGVQYVKYFLDSEGDARSMYGNGSLSTQQQSGGAVSDAFVYDPATPVQTLGAAICCVTEIAGEPGSYDQRPVEARSDVLVYTSERLEKPVTVVGDLEAVLYVSSSAKDTDFMVKLVDVHPDGRAFYVKDGILRARYREGLDREVFMEEGRIYELRINAEATATEFAPGHRIRLEVTSSSFPRFERNLNTGGRNYDETEWKVARNVVHHDERHPSHLILPVIESAPDASRQR